uniref:Bromo domain-containing protein n=1 Tax=Kalanchoe fedtschenkoi TaxID=63787 RepID=A0A7N0V2T3_KALFE
MDASILLMTHFLVSRDLLEELRKQRIAELRRNVEKYDGSIGFLQTKLQNLKAKKDHSSSIDYQASPLESPAQTSERQSSGKEPSKDGLSAGSFTQDIHKIRSPPIHAPTGLLGSPQIRPQAPPLPSGSSKQEKKPIAVDLVKIVQMKFGIGVKKKRGKRKRRGCGKAEPTSQLDESDQGSDGSKCNELTTVFDMILSNEYASIFRRRLDSQKRARYRNIVRQHMDLDTIRSRIDKRAVTTVKELLRDVLLLATNAALFYSRNTREHKYAVILKDIVIKLATEHKKKSPSSRTPPVAAPVGSPATTPSVKPTIPNTSAQRSPASDKLENSGQDPKTPPTKPDASHPIKAASNVNRQALNAKHGRSMERRSELKSAAASVNNKHSVKDGSRQQRQAPVKLPSSVNARSFRDLPRQLQPRVKVASVNELKRKRSRRIPAVEAPQGFTSCVKQVQIDA